jgi:hypothetical protein
VHYLTDVPELLVFVGSSTYVGMVFNADRVVNHEKYSDFKLPERLKRIRDGNISFIIYSEDEALSIVQGIKNIIQQQQQPSWR